MLPGMEHLIGFVSQAMEAQIWQDDGAVKLYLYCLSRASHNVFKWHGLSVQPGDMPLSERHAAEALSWSRNKLDRKLKALEISGLITVHSVTRMGTMVHVVRWPNLSWLHDGATNGARNEASLASRWSQSSKNWLHGGARLVS